MTKRFSGIALLASLLLAFAGCSGNKEDRAVADAVRLQMELYPESRLQDLYKAFFQAEFGAEHIVADTTAAGKYLDLELTVTDSTEIFYEPIGADSSYFRVHLKAVQDSLITRQELFDAFIGGVNRIEIPQIERWKDRWPEILKVIDRMNLNLPEYDSDRAMIDSVLATGAYAIHHSEAFSKAYDPHYRIIRKDLFEERLRGKIGRMRV